MTMTITPVSYRQNLNYNYNSIQKQDYNSDIARIYIKGAPLGSNGITPISFAPSFTRNSKVKIAEKALEKLSSNIEQGRKLTNADGKWLNPLKKFFGADNMIVNNPNNPREVITIDSALTISKINKDNGIETLANALKTMIAATKYKPQKVKLGNVTYTVHNKEISKLMKEQYNQEDFAQLTDYLNHKRVFDMTDNPNFGIVIDKQRGIPKICGASENWEMSDRSWITDIMRIGDIQKRERPETWPTAMNTIGDYYKTQQANFERLINNPSLYREGDPMQGIPHIFMPKTLEPDVNWFNNKRLESHGLALDGMTTCITNGLFKGAEYGYKSAKDIPQNVLEAMDNLSKYFKAIDYPTAPSAGNWEEIPLKGGLTSDTTAIADALTAYKNLLYNPKYSQNKEIQIVRTRLKELNPISKKSLSKLIQDGIDRVKTSYLEEAPGIRPHDASQVFITTSKIKLADDVHEDVKKNIEILKSVEKNLVRENGMIRYSPFSFKLKDGTIGLSPDSYLNLNYFNAVDKNGKLNLDWKNILDQFASKDCSEPEMFFARAKLSTEGKEAQWFMVSEMSTGYGKQIEKLVNLAKKEKRTLNTEEAKLIKELQQKQTEYLNRAIARISDEDPNAINQIKANGLDMPSVTVSEAHQYVTDTNGKTKMLQGTNAPLAWAVSSLYKAIKEQSIVMKKLNSLDK